MADQTSRIQRTSPPPEPDLQPFELDLLEPDVSVCETNDNS
jgi:hypothetical protein